MKLQRLCFAAALAASISFAFAACNGSDGGIPMTPGAPDSESGPQMPDPSESMEPQTAESAEPAPLGTPIVAAPNGPMMPESSTTPEASPTPEPANAPAASPAPRGVASSDVRPNSKSEARAVSVTVHLTQKKIPPGSYLWFDGTFALRGANSAAFQMQKSQIRLAGHTYSGPTGVVSMTPDTKLSNVRPSNVSIVSTFPSTTSSKMFMDGVFVYLPAGLPAHQTATWTARFQDAKPLAKELKIQWQTSVSAYSRFSSSYQSLQIKPLTGAPENFTKNLIPGTTVTASSRNVTICCR